MSYCQRPPAKSALLLAGLTLLLLPDSHALSTLQVGRSTSTSQEGGGDGRAACTGEGPLELHPANEAKCYLGKEGLPGNRTFGVSVQEEGFLNFKGSKRTGPKLEPYEVIGAAMLNASASPPIINLSSLAADANLTYCSDGDFLQLSAPSQSITVDIIRADCPENPVETAVSLLREGERQQRQRLSVKRLDFTPEDCGSSIGVTVKVFTDEYPRETRWEIRNDAGVVVAESGNYYYSSELTLYEWLKRLAGLPLARVTVPFATVLPTRPFITMHSAHEHGYDFVKSLSSEIKRIDESLTALRDTVLGIRGGLSEERHHRERAVEELADRLKSEIGTEVAQRLALEQRSEEFEANVRKWVGALGTESKALRERAGVIDTTVSKQAEQQAATDAKISLIEASLYQKAAKDDVELIAQRLSALQDGVLRNRVDLEAAIKNVNTAATTGLAEANSRIGTLHTDALLLQTEVSKKAMSKDVVALTATVDGLQSDVKTRALGTEVQALDLRLASAQRSIDTLVEEVHRCALASDVKGLSDRVGSLQARVEANRSLARSDHETLQTLVAEVKHHHEATEQRLTRDIETRATYSDHTNAVRSIDTVNTNLKAAERRMEADRDRAAECWVALEREVQTKCSKVDLDALNVRVVGAEKALPPIMESLNTKACMEDVQRLAARTNALEAGFGSKADADSFEKTRLQVNNHSARHDELHTRTEDHGQRLQAMSGQTHEHGWRIDATERKINELQSQVSDTISKNQLYTKQDVDRMLSDIYPKVEIDAMMSRVWWRVGQGKIGTPYAIRA